MKLLNFRTWKRYGPEAWIYHSPASARKELPSSSREDAETVKKKGVRRHRDQGRSRRLTHPLMQRFKALKSMFPLGTYREPEGKIEPEKRP